MSGTGRAKSACIGPIKAEVMEKKNTADEAQRLQAIAQHYDESPFDSAMRGYMMRTLQPWLRPGRALQVGCFHGDFTVELVKAYSDVTVLDATPEFLEYTRKRVGGKVRCELGLFEDYRATQRYDAVFLVHILEHVTEPVPFLVQARELLAPGGRVYVIVPNGAAASRRIAVKMGVLATLDALSEADRKHGHRRVYFLDTLQGDLVGAELSLTASGGIFFKPLANFQFDGLMGGRYVTEAYMEGCYLLGVEHPEMCASIYVVGEASGG
jgi:2-polyprenyl-3-methyl-5-hydroxy-6-metoxy-1,4-benzoquinol methylase